jgi:hypothetical protein
MTTMMACKQPKVMSSFYQVEHLTSKSMEKVVSLQPFDRNRTSSTCVHNFDVTISLLSLVFIVFGNKKKKDFLCSGADYEYAYLSGKNDGSSTSPSA